MIYHYYYGKTARRAAPASTWRRYPFCPDGVDSVVDPGAVPAFLAILPEGLAVPIYGDGFVVGVIAHESIGALAGYALASAIRPMLRPRAQFAKAPAPAAQTRVIRLVDHGLFVPEGTAIDRTGARLETLGVVSGGDDNGNIIELEIPPNADLVAVVSVLEIDVDTVETRDRAQKKGRIKALSAEILCNQ